MNNICNNCGWEKPPFTQKDAIQLCTHCLRELHGEEPTKLDLRARMKEQSHQRLSQLRSEESIRHANLADPQFHEKLSMDHPEFYRALEEYDAGNFTLIDGTQDPLLLWISGKVHNGYELPNWGMDSFRKRCAYYCEQRYSGEEMEPYQQTGSSVQEAVGAIEGPLREGTLSKKDATIAKSIKDQYALKKWLTKKQVKMLNILREKQ